jgi:hypothetical protein
MRLLLNAHESALWDDPQTRPRVEEAIALMLSAQDVVQAFIVTLDDGEVLYSLTKARS